MIIIVKLKKIVWLLKKNCNEMLEIIMVVIKSLQMNKISALNNPYELICY